MIITSLQLSILYVGKRHLYLWINQRLLIYRKEHARTLANENFGFLFCFKHNHPCMIFKVALKYLFEFYRKMEFENNWNKCNWNECNRMQAGNAIEIFLEFYWKYLLENVQRLS